MESKRISKNMLTRMPIYLNYIKSLPENTKYVSATKIANALGLGEVSVRKDLAKVSDGGRCKLGYICEELIVDIEDFLDIKSMMNTIIVGKGDMLPVLLGYEGFVESGVDVIAGFDMNSKKTRSTHKKPIYPMDELQGFCAAHEIRMAILMVSSEHGQAICDQLTSNGVEAIWNFTPMHLNVPEHVVVRNENITTSVIELRMLLKERNEAF